MKRTLALFLTLCMALSMFSFPAFAAEADVAVLDEAALVETETTPAPTEDVVAPVAAEEPAYTLAFPDKTKEVEYNAKDQSLADMSLQAAVLTKTPADAPDATVTYTVLNGGTYNSFAAAIEGRSVKTLEDSVQIVAEAKVGEEVVDSDTLIVSVVPYDFKNGDVTLDWSAATLQYGNVKDLDKVTFSGMDADLMAEMQKAITVTLYSDSHKENKVTDAATVAYEELYAEVSLGEGPWANFKAPALAKLTLVKNNTEAGATFAFKKDVYNTSVDAKEKDLPAAEELIYIGSAKNLGAVTGTPTWVVFDEATVKAAGGLDKIVWPWEATAEEPATAGSTSTLPDGTTAGIWYVGATIADDDYYTNLTLDKIVEVNVAKSEVGIQIKIGDKDITKETVEIPYGGSSSKVTVVATADPNLKDNTLTYEVVGSGDIGFKGDNTTNKPYLPGTYKVKVTQAAGTEEETSKTGTFKIVPADVTGMSLKLESNPSDKKLSSQFKTTEPAAGVLTKDTDYTLSTSVTNAAGQAFSGDVELPAGTYTVTYQLTPKDVAVPKSDGYSTETYKTVKTANPVVLTETFTIAPDELKSTVELTFMGEPTPKWVKYNSDFTISAKDVVGDTPYLVIVNDANVTETANYTLDLMYTADEKTWEKVDGFKGAGVYSVAATVVKDGKSASSDPADSAQAGVFIQVDPGALNIKYNMPKAVADGTTDYSKALEAKGVFELTDKITGKTVTAKDIEVQFTDKTPAKPTLQDNYSFTATFDCDGLYMDDTIVTNQPTYSGVFKVLGKNSATVEFKSGDYSVEYTGKSLQFNNDSVTVSDNVKAPVVTFTYEKMNDKGVYTASAAPKAYGTYRVTATLQPETESATNGDSTSIIVKVTPTNAKLTLDDAEKTNKEFVKGDGTSWPLATLAGVNSENQDTVLNGSKLTYRFYKDGKLMTDEDGEPYTSTDEVGDLDAQTEPGVYTMTVEWTNTKEDANKALVTANENYNPAVVVTSKSYTLKQSAFDSKDLPAYNTTDDNALTIAYGTVKAGALVYKPAEGEFKIADTVSGSVNSMKEFSAKIVFVPADKTVASYTIPMNQTVKVVPYKLTADDVKVVGTKVDKFDGKEYALTSVAVTPKFESDRSFLKVEYNSYNGKGWVTDITKATRTSSGIVSVRVTDTREIDPCYAPATFNGFIEIGKSELSTLVLENVDRTYLDDGKPFAPKLVIKTPGLADKIVDTADVDYEIADYTENMDNAWFDNAKENGDVHAAEKPYYVKATIKTNALTNKYSTYNLGENTQAVAYSICKVSPITLDMGKLAETIDTGAKLETTVDTNAKLQGITLTNVKGGKNDATNFAVLQTNTAKNVITGTWAWKNADADRDAYADYTVVFTPGTVTTLAGGTKCTPTDYVKPSVKLNPTVTAAQQEATGTVKVTPEKVPYGTTLGDLTVDTKNVTVPGGLKGTWIWADGNDFVMPVGKHATKPVTGTAADNAQFVLVFRADEKPLNYNIVTYVAVEVTKGEPTLVVTNTTMGYTGNPASLKVETNNTEAEPKLTWYDANGNTMAGAPTQIGSYKVKVSLPETDSFLAKSVTVDYTITYNQTGIEGFVYRLYAVALGREPDQSGYTMWVNLLKSKEYTPKSVANGFIFSPEFQNRKYDNATFLKVMYSTFMDREPDASGYTMWLKGLNSGEYTREFVFQGFADSREFTNICARYGL